MTEEKKYKRRKPKRRIYDYTISFDLTEEEFIIFEREWLEFMKSYNVKITRSNFMRKIFRDFVGRRYSYRRKRLPRYQFKDY